MTTKELDKLVSAHFSGNAWRRFVWSCTNWAHAYVELCKTPGLLVSEEWADRTKHIVAVMIPFLLLVILRVG